MRVYLNNAATSFPKPPEVLDAVMKSLAEPPSEPGRVGGGRDTVHACRLGVAELFGVTDAHRVTLLPSATYALNAALLGLVRPGDHVVTTMLEHNSVLRPIAHLAVRGVDLSRIAPDGSGLISSQAVEQALRPTTRAVVITHASNVTGGIQPIESIAAVVARHGAVLIVDAAQSSGCVSLDHESLPGRVFVAFAGHKGLYGPAGTGGLIVPDDELEQTVFGGTGVRSEAELHPGQLPLRHEAGTPNLPGIAGLEAGVAFVTRKSVDALGQHRANLVRRLREGLSRWPAVRLSPLPNDDGRAGVVSFEVEGWSPADLGLILRESYDIEVRTGLHCAPAAHEWLGTRREGNVRASVGAFNTDADVDALVRAIGEIGGT